MSSYINTLDYAREQDGADSLRSFREKFHFPATGGKPVLYFTGNSLGLQPKTAKRYIEEELSDWAEFGVEGHTEARRPWVSYEQQFPALLAPVVGALPHEIVAMNSLTANLHLMMVSFYQPTDISYKIVCEAGAFPSDNYAFETQLAMYGFSPEDALVELAPRQGEETLRTEDIIATIEDLGAEIALVALSGVQYYTGQRFDMKAITAAAKNVGAYVGWDLAHAVGNVELALHEWEVDFAVWCTYKYLNSGPGAVGGAFVHEQHANNTDMPRFGGWWGNDLKERFQMKKGFRPAKGAQSWQLSNAPVMNMAAHLASLEIFKEAGMECIFAKRDALTGYLEFILHRINLEKGREALRIITPTDKKQRGAQLSIVISENGKQVYQSLKEQGVIVDWREPDVIRVAPAPLYNSFEDVFLFGQALSALL